MRQIPIACGGCARSIFSRSYTARCKWCDSRRDTLRRHHNRRARRSPRRYLAPAGFAGATLLSVLVAMGGRVG